MGAEGCRAALDQKWFLLLYKGFYGKRKKKAILFLKHSSLLMHSGSLDLAGQSQERVKFASPWE